MTHYIPSNLSEEVARLVQERVGDDPRLFEGHTQVVFRKEKNVGPENAMGAGVRHCWFVAAKQKKLQEPSK